MDEANNLGTLKNLLVDILNCREEDLKDENGPDQISNWDSITHMELISKIEDKFDIELDVDEINQMDTIGLIKNTLKKHGLKL